MLQQISETHSDFTGVSNPLPCSWLPVLGFWSFDLPWPWHFEEQWLFTLWNMFQFGYMIHHNSDELIHFGGRILADAVHVSQYGGTLMLMCTVTGWFSLNYSTKGARHIPLLWQCYFFSLWSVITFWEIWGLHVWLVFLILLPICLSIQQCSDQQICSWGTPVCLPISPTPYASFIAILL